ncbi:substrate-binding domain-containing protein [Pseudodesulfovibrio sp.]|nr:substrate-binding domain-containing protein [Pseudodesulfovibrio sp.]
MKRPMILLPLVALCLLILALPAVAQDPYPIDVDVWDPPFNTERKRTQEKYQPYPKASKEWKICVSIPHLKDAYWLAVNHSIIDEAKRLGVAVNVYEAGGYGNLEQQRSQVQGCMDSGADGLILSAVNFDKLNDLVEKYAAEGRPVVDLINGISSPKIAARTAATYWDNGYLTGKHPAESRLVSRPQGGRMGCCS